MQKKYLFWTYSLFFSIVLISIDPIDQTVYCEKFRTKFSLYLSQAFCVYMSWHTHTHMCVCVCVKVIKSYWQHEVLWFNLTIYSHHPLLLEGPLNNIQCPQSWGKQVFAGQPILVYPCVGVYRRTSLTSSSLLLQQCLAYLVHLT